MKIAAGAWEATLRPEIGGAIASLRRNGAEVLRSMPPAATSPLEAACFPLVPYCNRIRGGRFSFDGHEVALPANFAPEAHSLHGLGWQRPWRIEGQWGSECLLVDEYDGNGAWLWAYRAEQRVRLTPRGCMVMLTLANRSNDAMPAGLGLHPYFRRQQESALHFAAYHVLRTGPNVLPTGVTAPANHFADWGKGALLPLETVDHCFVRWNGEAHTRDDLGTILLTATGAPHLHVYAPVDGSALCLEPVTHTPDAPNRAPREMIVLPPGCVATMTMRIAVE